MSAKKRPNIHNLPAAVYRLFDEHGVLLYVGASYDPNARIKRHMAKSWGSEIARTKVSWYDDRRTAFGVEAIAIREEEPRYNRDSPNPQSFEVTGIPSEADYDRWDEDIVRALTELGH